MWKNIDYNDEPTLLQVIKVFATVLVHIIKVKEAEINNIKRDRKTNDHNNTLLSEIRI